MKPSGVIFDFDGVLVDSLNAHLTAWTQAYDICFGLPLDPKFYADLVGHSTIYIAGYLCRLAGVPEGGTRLAETKSKWLNDNIHSVPLLSGVKESFQYLRAVGIPFGIASNAPIKFIRKVLAHHKLELEVVLGREDAPRPKPAPDPFLLCAQRLAIPVSQQKQAYIFEDSVHGLAAARLAQMFPIGVTSQKESATLLNAGALITCANLAEALEQGWFTTLPLPIS